MNALATPPAATILVVDDEERNVKLLQTLLQAEGYQTLSALNGRQALQVAADSPPDLILLDIMMPDMDGFATVERLKANPLTRQVPVIMVTSLDDRETRQHALLAGAEEFLSKPIVRADLTVRVRNLLRLKQYSDLLQDQNLLLETLVKKRTEQLEEAYRDTVLTLVRAAEHKDEETGRHVRRISHYCGVLAQAMALPEAQSDVIFHASPMHDVGKIGIPDHILLKPGPLDTAEWAVMKTHCTLGAHILHSGTSPYTQMGQVIAQHHHEHWDGTGYPNGLRGEAIPLPARIMQVCDVYDALRSRRPYKPSLAHAQAMTIITQGDGRTQPGHFDPAVLDSFQAQAGQMATIYAELTDE
jgi:putative two-component system response regulator